MAINKNFVIKNGVQVSTDLIIGDADNNKVGIGTTIPGYDLHVARGRKSRGGIGATDLVVTGVSTVKDVLVTGFSGFSSDVSVTGIVSARSFGIGTTEIIDRGMRLSGIASLDAITINTIEQAIRVGPNSFTDLKVTGISTFIGIATFSTGIDIKSGVSTFSAPLRLGFAHTTDHAGVALGATVGFGTSAFFRDDAAIFMGSDSDLKIHHDGSNSRIQDVGTGDLIIQGSADIKLQSASAENYIVANDTGSVDVYFDNSKKLETTSGGLKVTGITTLTDRLHVEAGISTFDADVRFGIGATVGFGTSAFFRDDAAIFLGNDSDLKIHHDGSNSRIQDVGTGDLILQGSADIKLQSASAENYIVANDTGSVEQYFDNSKKTETTSGGFKVTGITTLTNRLHVQAGVSTFDADVRFGIGATVGFGTSAFFLDNAAIFMGDQEDLKIFADQDGDVRIQQQNAGKIIISSTGAGDAIQLQARHGEQSLIARVDGAVEQYYDNSKKTETTSGGFNITGITTFSDRINVVSGVSTFQDNAKLTFGTQSDLIVYHSGSHSFIQDTTGTGNLYIDSNSLQIRNAAGDETQATFAENGAVSLFYDNGNVFQTTPQGVNVSGVTTSNRLNISGVSTFNGALDVNSTSNFSDDVTLVAAGSSTILFDASNHDLTFQDNIRAKFGTGKDLTVYHNGANSFIDNTNGNLFVRNDNAIIFEDTSSGHNFLKVNNDGTTSNVELYHNNSIKLQTTSGGLNVTGITTISDRLQVTSGISTFYDTTQSTSATTGAVVLDGGLGVAKNVNIGGNLTVTGTSTFNGGTITLGDADTDNVVFSADVDSNIIPDDDDSFDLGSSTKEWQDLFLDGTAHIDVLDVDETAFVTTKLTVGTGVTIQNHGGVSIAGITTIGGNLTVTGTATQLELVGNEGVSAALRLTADQGDDDGDGWEIRSNQDDNDLTFKNDTSGSYVDKLTLKNNGDLHILDKIIHDGDTNTAIRFPAADTVTVETAGAERLRITSVGIATFKEGGTGNGMGGVVASTATGGGNAGFQWATNSKGRYQVTTIGSEGSENLRVYDIQNAAERLRITNVGDVKVGSGVTFQQNGNVAIAGISTLGGQANAVSGVHLSSDNIANGLKIGAGEDLILYHENSGNNGLIFNKTGDLYIQGNDGSGSAQTQIQIHSNAEVDIKHQGNIRITTTADGTDFGGTGSIRVPNGTTAQRNSSPAAGDFRYNTTTGKFEGYTDEWGDIGGSGGVEEADTSVSTTSATSCGSFAKASFRSAAIIAQITQGSNYQVGRYLLIHDGTTVTTLEESAVATGSMLGTFEGVINGSNVEFRVTMGSSSSATVTTKIDTVTV